MKLAEFDGRHVLACVGMLIILCLYFTGRPWPELAVAVTAIVSLLSVLISSITKETVARTEATVPPPALPSPVTIHMPPAAPVPAASSLAPVTLAIPPGGQP